MIEVAQIQRFALVVAASMFIGRTEREDCASEMVLRALQVQQRDSGASWPLLKTVMINRGIDLQRADRRDRAISLDTSFDGNEAFLIGDGGIRESFGRLAAEDMIAVAPKHAHRMLRLIAGGLDRYEVNAVMGCHRTVTQRQRDRVAQAWTGLQVAA